MNYTQIFCVVKNFFEPRAAYPFPIAFLFRAPPTHDMLDYVIRPLPEARLFRVELALGAPKAETLTLYLPSWTFGSYVERAYSGRVRNITASCEGAPLVVDWYEADRWRVSLAGIEPGNRITLAYDVFANSLGIHDAYIDEKRGFINPSALFIMPLDGTTESPNGDWARVSFPDEWSVCTTLARRPDRAFGAPSREALLDAPMTLLPLKPSEAVRFLVDACGVEHEIVVTGTASLNTKRIAKDLRTIFETVIRFWDPNEEKVPFSRYVVHLHLSPKSYGGLEHADGCVLLEDLYALPAEGETEPPKAYSEFLSLVAHEYFHAWLVRRLRPTVIVEADLTRPVYTDDLWIFEGITSYYESRLLELAGLRTAEETRKALVTRLNAAWGREGFDAMSLERSSRLAWVKLYRPTADSLYSTVSYYAKGAFAALLLDEELRTRTCGRASLDTVLAAWWARDRASLANGTYRGLAPGGFAEVVRGATGIDLTAFIASLTHEEGDRALWGERLDAALARRGLKRRPDPSAPAALRLAGLSLKKEADGRSTVTWSALGSPSRAAGLFPGDELLAVDGLRCRPDEIDRQFERATGRKVVLHWFRENRIFEGVLDLTRTDTAWQALLPFELADLHAEA